MDQQEANFDSGREHMVFLKGKGKGSLQSAECVEKASQDKKHQGITYKLLEIIVWELAFLGETKAEWFATAYSSGCVSLAIKTFSPPGEACLQALHPSPTVNIFVPEEEATESWWFIEDIWECPASASSECIRGQNK